MQYLGRPVVKVFNSSYADHLEKKGQPTGTPDRISLPATGDEAATKRQVRALVEEMGFDAVDDGTLHQSWRQQPGTPCYGAGFPADKLRENLASLGTERTEAPHQQFLGNHAEQEKQMAS
ncbi:NADPH-dependent F420 reductase [Hymenobacter sp. PAMC 26628]|uniref:NADPH-dependent F420 reductase n=1 Tax=Hymenobacter sp. PAMC 26628 TaxID=1484118 RepID=UPI00194F3109|nr:hypothetical protein [Hymenobacter sp. PAMC 26628]